MTTLADLRALLRLTLADTDIWPDAALNAWIGQGIRFYSAHYPQLRHASPALTRDVRVVPLPAEVMRVLAVTYDIAAFPHHLRIVPLAAGGLTLDTMECTVRTAADGVTLELVLGASPLAGDEIVVSYFGAHPVPALDTDIVTVPAQHLEALTVYVIWAAHAGLACNELALMNEGTLALAQAGDEARRAWLRLKDVYNRLEYLALDVPTSTQAAASWAACGL